MNIVLVTGGARSGKSRYAAAEAARLGGDGVSFVATGRVTDDEMARRIDRHRADRSPSWETVEAQGDAAGGIARARHAVVLLDCLTFALADALTAADETDGEEAALARVERAVTALLAAADQRRGTLLVVTNEVGMGIVPATPWGRWFRDAQGWANQRVAAAADEVFLVVCGLPLRVKG